jgi:hypothetical protein
MIKLTDILKQLLSEEKVKRDRCLRIADRKFDKPSAYKSGAVVRCRKGSIWKGVNENTQKYINWNENYGKTFKIVSTPKGAQSEGEWNPDLVSIVTPENGGAWNNWKEVSQDVLNHFKKNWDEIQKSLGDHKYNQIIRSQQLNEEITPNEAYRDESAIKTVLDGKRNLGFITLDGSTLPEQTFWDTIKKFNLDVIKVPSNPYKAFIYFVKGHQDEAEELKSIAEKYDGYLSYKATEEDTRRIGELLGYKKEDIDSYINKRYGSLDEKKESLNKWFKRKGAPGKTGGWVDCNTCRDGKCKPCGRAKGETRAKYPSCQPTPSACKRPGKGKTWGKTK